MKTREYLIIGFLGLFIVIAAWIIVSRVPVSFSSATSGLAARIATSSTENLPAATNIPNLVATSTCVARIITVGQITLFTFNGLPATLGSGVYQAASTTVAYDSGLYGCGAVNGMTATAETITVMESQ